MSSTSAIKQPMAMPKAPATPGVPKLSLPKTPATGAAGMLNKGIFGKLKPMATPKSSTSGLIPKAPKASKAIQAPKGIAVGNPKMVM